MRHDAPISAESAQDTRKSFPQLFASIRTSMIGLKDRNQRMSRSTNSEAAGTNIFCCSTADRLSMMFIFIKLVFQFFSFAY